MKKFKKINISQICRLIFIKSPFILLHVPGIHSRCSPATFLIVSSSWWRADIRETKPGPRRRPASQTTARWRCRSTRARRRRRRFSRRSASFCRRTTEKDSTFCDKTRNSVFFSKWFQFFKFAKIYFFLRLMFFSDGFYFCTCLVVSFDTHVERNFLIMISHFFMMNKFEFYLNPFLPDPGLFLLIESGLSLT